MKIDGKSLSLQDIWDVAHAPPGSLDVELSAPARTKVRIARQFILKKLKGKEAIYGVNTGFGLLSNVRVSTDKLDELQENLIRSHSVGLGQPLSEPETRAILLLRANALASGHSGVSEQLIDALLAMLNAGVHPVIPEQGSVGACGDLAPLAHMSLTLIGEGEATFEGRVMDSAAALKKARLKPFRLGVKEGLSLINGTQVMTAIGILTYLRARKLADHADLAAAMTLESLKG